MKIKVFLVLLLVFLLNGCQKAPTSINQTTSEENQTAASENIEKPEQSTNSGIYEEITQDKAKEYMNNEEPAVILDVRTYEEYNEGHIDGALCIPVELITGDSQAMIEQLIPRKDQMILVYCRSGNRSKTASQKLADMGYINVKEFGGINDWQYGTVTE